MKERVTTLPAVPTDQNGSGVSAVRCEVFDLDGRLIWAMDERGFLTRAAYDVATGAMTQLIQDVDTAQVSDEPAGWSTPTGGGLHVVTDFEHDAQGRITEMLGPEHTIDLGGVATLIRRATWLVYKEGEEGDEQWVGQGYATGEEWDTFTLVNPVSITKTDKNGQVRESIQAARASTSGKLQASDSFPQSSYTRWTTQQYTDCCFLASTRAYHTIPASGAGAEGTNYDEVQYGYDALKRRIREVTGGGTITRTVLDARGNALAIYVGTDDTGATASDPTGGGASGNNMVVVTENEYDGGQDGGDNNLTEQSQYAATSDTRVTSFAYDWRNRQTDTDGEIDFYQKSYFDNLDRTVKSERYDTTSGGNLIGRSETKFDDLGRVFRSITYGVNPSTGAVGNALTSNTWYDAAGNVIKQLPAGSKRFSKLVYDSLDRRAVQYDGFDVDESTYAEAQTVDGDTILQQTELSYDKANNNLQTTIRERYHNATGTGALNGPAGPQPKARVTYAATWQDALGRSTAMANYGTNGGTALTRPSTIPARSVTVLVSSMTYNAAGDMSTQTNPGGVTTCFEYDAVGRQVKQVLNCVHESSSSSSSSSAGGMEADDVNVTVLTSYNADGNTATLTAKNAATGDQTTTYVYGTTLADSEIASSLLKRKEIYPDSEDEDDVIAFSYNRQGEVIEVKDQGGTIHAFDFDKLGRQTQDRVTDLGSGVDAAIRRIATTYEVRGMKEKLTSYDNATVGSGSTVNETQFTYNDFEQISTDYQAHSGAVNTGTTPKVQYGYANGSANTIRQTAITYPNGRVITSDYGSANDVDDALSRVKSIVDDDMASTHLAEYTYLGINTFVEVDYTEPEIKYTLAGTAGGDDPDTGDIYRGFDRFGRIKDSYWYDYGGSADLDRIKYGYDRNGSRLYRENTVATALGKSFDELYRYDDIDRLKTMDRGDLTALKDAINNLQFAQDWRLDATGNWQRFRVDEDGTGGWELDQTRIANKVNEIEDISESAGPSWVTPAYSRAGNMTTIPKPADPTVALSATYDGWNRLVKIVEGANTVAEYAYDAAKRRTIKKTYASGVLDETRHFYYSEPAKWQVLEERVDATSTSDRHFVWGLRYVDDLILRERDTNDDATLDERLYGLQDANWNVTAVAGTSGAIQERLVYDAYGTPVVLTPTFAIRGASIFDWEIRFAGYRWDSEFQSYQVRHRGILPWFGWVQRDPLDGPSSRNLYEYADNSPLTNVDPSGLKTVLRPTDDVGLVDRSPICRPGIPCNRCHVLGIGRWVVPRNVSPDPWNPPQVEPGPKLPRTVDPPPIPRDPRVNWQCCHYRCTDNLDRYVGSIQRNSPYPGFCPRNLVFDEYVCDLVASRLGRCEDAF